MSAYCTATVNEDGIIEPCIEGRMDPEEYKTMLAKVQLKVEPSAIRALETLADIMEPTITPLHCPDTLPPCAICGGDAHWHATPWGTGYCVDLCNDCHATRMDQYQEFTRIG